MHNTNHSPINILVISPYFFPAIGGSQRYMEELYVHITRQFPQVHVHVVTYNTERAVARERHRGISLYRIPCVELIRGQFALPNIVALLGVLQFLSKKHIDFVHTHIRFFDATWWAWIYARIIGAKSIFTEQVAAHPVHRMPQVQWIARFVDATIAKWSIAQYDLITTTNRSAKVFLEKTLGIKKQITVSYGGVDTKFFSPKRTKEIPNTTLVLPKKTTVVTFAGRLIWSKGITYFLRALEQIKRWPAGVHVVIAGEGPLAGYIKKTIEKKHLHAHVTFLGPLDYHDMRQLFRATDIFVHPSHHNEGFPNVLLEALSSGCFVIASDNAGTSEMMEHGKHGLLIPQKNTTALHDAVMWALSHKKERREMQTDARKHIKIQFNWNQISTSFFRLVQHSVLSHAWVHQWSINQAG